MTKTLTFQQRWACVRLLATDFVLLCHFCLIIESAWLHHASLLAELMTSPLAHHYGQRLRQSGVFGMQRMMMMAGANHSVTLRSEGCDFTSIRRKANGNFENLAIFAIVNVMFVIHQGVFPDGNHSKSP